MIHSLAGKPVPHDALIDVPKLVATYYTSAPDATVAAQRVAFGTSGHRGSSLAASFNERHILAICQAIVEHRRSERIDGPLFVGADTHALSEPALRTAIEVFGGNDVRLIVQANGGYTPTPVISHAIVQHNRGRRDHLADGVVITPSHNPPDDGGFKYNPPSGGPAGSEITSAIASRANAILESKAEVRRLTLTRAMRRSSTAERDLIGPYVEDLQAVIDLELIATAKLKIGVDPLGGASVGYWEPIAERYGLDLELVNRRVDPTFSFMTLDHDGKVRMDCSSRHAMAGLIALKDRFDVAFANDPDADRHGIVTRSAGLLNPNDYLAVAVDYLFSHRPGWSTNAAVGKTLVSSSMIDRVTWALGRQLCEVPVGFKWFVDGLLDGRLGFGGEESAGASFLRRDGQPWTTDKDGIVLGLLAAEITARRQRDPAELYGDLVRRFGQPVYRRTDAPATAGEKALLKQLSGEAVTAQTLAGDPIIAKLTRAPGNDASIGGLKVVTEKGWFAARPSGTEAIYKIYAESFQDQAHLSQIEAEAQAMVSAVFQAAEKKQ